jgi:hypothetical protein
VSKGIRVFQDCAAIHEDVERCYSDVQYAYSDKCVWVDGPRKVFAQEVKRAYWACISYVDAQVGRIVAALKAEGLYDSTVISFNGDHGYRESSSTTRPVLSCPALPCPALPCPALPCPALSCPVLRSQLGFSLHVRCISRFRTSIRRPTMLLECLPGCCMAGFRRAWRAWRLGEVHHVGGRY